MNDLKLQFFMEFQSLPKIYIVESLYTDQCISETHQQRGLLSRIDYIYIATYMSDFHRIKPGKNRHKCFFISFLNVDILNFRMK